jgi:hypothetical protein
MRLKEMRSTSDFHLPRNNTKTLIKSTNHILQQNISTQNNHYIIIIIEFPSNDAETLFEHVFIIQCLVNIRKQFADSGKKIKDDFFFAFLFFFWKHLILKRSYMSLKLFKIMNTVLNPFRRLIRTQWKIVYSFRYTYVIT